MLCCVLCETFIQPAGSESQFESQPAGSESQSKSQSESQSESQPAGSEGQPKGEGTDGLSPHSIRLFAAKKGNILRLKTKTSPRADNDASDVDVEIYLK